MTNAIAPTPTSDESFDRYSIRAQRAMFAEVRDPFERMRVIRHTWRQHRGQTPEEQLADRKFSPDRYQKAEDVCVFSEHETTDSQGQPRKYDLRKLARIVRYCNERALEHEAFAAIADRHTSNPGDPNPTEPKVMGYAGPYRLGLIGQKKPTWAIFTDEYRFPGEAETFLQKNRRSVELWTDKKTGRMWFDPLTTCGADAPRLPLPAQYQEIQHGGATLERYTAAAGGFATAGLGSTTVPQHRAPKPPSTPRLDSQNYEAGSGAPARPKQNEDPDDRAERLAKEHQARDMAEQGGWAPDGSQGPYDQLPGKTPQKTKYDAASGAPTQNPIPGGNPMDPTTGQPPTLEQIVEAVMSLPPIQWASQKMAEQAPGPGGMDQLSPSPSAAPPQGPPPGAPPTPAPGGPPGAPPTDSPPGDEDYGDLDDLLGDDEDQPPAPGAPGDATPATEKEKNSMAYSAPQNPQLELQRYQASHERLVREHGRTLERLQALEREATDAKRQSRFAKLRADHPAFPLDDDELKPALYSLGGNMTDQEFDRHVATLEKYAARFVQPVVLPGGEAERSEPDATAEKYAAKLSRAAVTIATAAADAGQPMTWDEAYAKAKATVQQ